MNYLVVGAGNASRPVARLLNFLGHDVTVTDLKDISEFKIEFQRSLLEMEKEGVKLDMANKARPLKVLKLFICLPLCRILLQ